MIYGWCVFPIQTVQSTTKPYASFIVYAEWTRLGNKSISTLCYQETAPALISYSSSFLHYSVTHFKRVGLLSQFPPFRYFPNFSVLSKYTVAIEYHIYIKFLRSSAAVASVKYKRDSKNLRCTGAHLIWVVSVTGPNYWQQLTVTQSNL